MEPPAALLLGCLLGRLSGGLESVSWSSPSALLRVFRLLPSAAFGCLERVSEMGLSSAIRGAKGYLIGGAVREVFLP